MCIRVSYKQAVIFITLVNYTEIIWTHSSFHMTNRIIFILHGLYDIPVQNGVPQGSLYVLTPRCVWTNIDFVMGHETVPTVMMKNSASLLHRTRKLRATSHTTQKVNNCPKRLSLKEM